MSTKPSPSSTLYVVTLKDAARETVARRLGDKGSVEPIKGRSDLALVKLSHHAANPRDAWQDARKSIGGGSIQPVLLDSDGKTQYPTGEVSVRFHEAPTEDQIRAFARTHGLRLLRRNEFAPQQAVFEVVESNRYLPDLVDDLSESRDVRVAWANTLAEYERH
jgi:hypothetical protein